MAEGPERETRTGRPKRRWNKEREKYVCTNGVRVWVKVGLLKSGVGYLINRPARLFVSGTEFCRDMSRVEGATRKIKILALPNSVKEVADGAFQYTYLESVILNEGLERLGVFYGEDDNRRKGVFSYTRIKRIVLPSTLRVLEAYTFSCCTYLSKIATRQTTQAGGANDALRDLRCGEAVLPAALEKVGTCILIRCPEIKVIWFENCSLINADTNSDSCNVAILPARSTMVGDKLLKDLRR